MEIPYIGPMSMQNLQSMMPNKVWASCTGNQANLHVQQAFRSLPASSLAEMGNAHVLPEFHVFLLIFVPVNSIQVSLNLLIDNFVFLNWLLYKETVADSSQGGREANCRSPPLLQLLQNQSSSLITNSVADHLH